jgi:NAD(P)-dependent dehydrogenase (short-subunit alcohol dehydrogenase family)
MASGKKVALITGAGSGIGRAAALALHEIGYDLVLAGRRPDALEETVKLAKNTPPEMLCVPTDIADADQVAALFARTKETFGRLDVLFNNAGIGAPRIPMEDLQLEDWRRVVDVNLTGSFMCAQEAIRIMKSQDPKGGRIINNGSVSAHVPRPDTVAYTATKHAMTGLTRSISLDGRKHNIACSQIDIGNAESPLAERFKQGVPQANGDIRVEPVFDVTHVGRAIAYMAELPLDANVQFMTLMATQMPYIGRG